MSTPSTQLYSVYIRATAEDIWDALTRPDITERYFYGARIENTPEEHRARGPADEDWGDGAVLEFDPPHRLAHEWRSGYDPELAAEQRSRVTWEITPQSGGFCLLTLTHDRLENSPRTAADVSGTGWTYVLSSLKSLLETGDALPRAD